MGIVVVFWKKKIVVFKLNIWYSLERCLLSNYYKNMNTFSILLTLAYQIIPIVLFVWLILYLAKKNSSSKNVTPTIENTSPKQNRLKKIILIIVFLIFALPGLFVWLALL